jgi:hypothetical protein
MEIRSRAAIWTSFFVLPFLLLASFIAAQEKKKGSDKYICSETSPGKMCNASTTCGSGSTACVVDIKRKGGSSASAVPSIPNVKATGPFCVKVGTTVTFQSTSKDTGFVLDFGPSSPFDPPGAIIGGSDRSVSVVAKRKGCFKYSAGACTSGTIYGMCGSVDTEIVVTDIDN